MLLLATKFCGNFLHWKSLEGFKRAVIGTDLHLKENSLDTYVNNIMRKAKYKCFQEFREEIMVLDHRW